MEADQEIIIAKDLCKSFGSGNSVFKAVDRVSFSINRGKIYGLVGENGAGKTTTIKLIMGLVKPTSGEIMLNLKAAYPDYYKKIGYVPEKVVLYDEMLPLEYLMYMAAMSGIEKSKAMQGAGQLLKEFDLESASGKKTKTFSSGMKQKLLIAQALLHEPEVLVLDEPTNALDPIGQKQLLDLLKRLAKEKGTTVIISSHHMEELELIVDSVLIFDKGRLVLESYIKSLKKNQKAGKSLWEIVTEKLKK